MVQDFKLEHGAFSTHVLNAISPPLPPVLSGRSHSRLALFSFNLMDIRGKNFDWRAGLIGSHTVDALLREDVGEVIVYDNFVRGRRKLGFCS